MAEDHRPLYLATSAAYSAVSIAVNLSTTLLQSLVIAERLPALAARALVDEWEAQSLRTAGDHEDLQTLVRARFAEAKRIIT